MTAVPPQLALQGLCTTHSPPTAFTAIGCPGNVEQNGSDYQHTMCLHLSSSRGNFSWVQ